MVPLIRYVTNHGSYELGQWGFFDAGSRHEIANAGDVRVELIEVELRRR